MADSLNHERRRGRQAFLDLCRATDRILAAAKSAEEARADLDRLVAWNAEQQEQEAASAVDLLMARLTEARQSGDKAAERSLRRSLESLHGVRVQFLSKPTDRGKQ